MADVCINDTCSIIHSTDANTGALILNTVLGNLGGIDCVSGLKVNRWLNSAAVSPATLDGLCADAIGITTDNQLYVIDFGSQVVNFGAGVSRDILTAYVASVSTLPASGVNPNPSLTANFTNPYNCSVLVKLKARYRIHNHGIGPNREAWVWRGSVQANSNIGSVAGLTTQQIYETQYYGPPIFGDISNGVLNNGGMLETWYVVGAGASLSVDYQINMFNEANADGDAGVAGITGFTIQDCVASIERYN